MRISAGALILISALGAAGAAFAADANPAAKEKWERIGTPDFELYTNAGETAAREALNHLQQVRGFFLKASPLPLLDQFPVRIVVFRTHEQFAFYVPAPGELAFFVSSPKRDYIAMADSPSDYRYAIHEYMHLIVRHSGLRLPTWLNEGWAEVYSTLRPVSDGVAVGDLVETRMHTLQSSQWLDIDTLTSVDTRSPIYQGKGPTDVFYAESWALAHMLFLAPDYSPDFPKFLTALHRGRNFADACQAAFGKTPAEVYSDLRNYFQRKKMYGKVFEAPLDKKAPLPPMTVVDPFDVRLLLADLAGAVGRRDEAKREYAELSADNPKRYEIAESLGYLAVADRNFASARALFEKAFADGDPDPRMCVQLAFLEERDKQPPERAATALERALKTKPDYADALLQLGLLRIETGEYRSGVEALMKVDRIRPEQASAVYAALAYGFLQLGDLDRARRDGQTARQYTQDPTEAKRLDGIIALAAARAASPFAPKPGEKTERVEGAIRQVDCTAAGNRLVLTIGNRVMRFELPDMKAVELVKKGDGALTLTCGPQQPTWITLDYAPASVVEKTTEGVVRRIEF